MQQESQFQSMYPEIQDWLQQGHSDMQADEAHGLLCGLLMGHDGDVESRWLNELFSDGQMPADDPSQDLMQSVFEQTRAQFNDESFGFFLMLPDEDWPLAERTEALGRWCQGLLLGLGYSGLSDDSDMPDEVREVIGDIAHIAGVAPDLEDPGRDDEADFVEVAEYIRMATLLLAEHLRGPGPDAVLH